MPTTTDFKDYYSRETEKYDQFGQHGYNEALPPRGTNVSTSDFDSFINDLLG